MKIDDAPDGAQALDGVDELSLRAFRELRDTMRANGHAMGRRFAAKGAHMGQAACLRVLDGRDGISQRDLADILHVSRPSITAMLQAVEKAGLVVRKPDESDQRLTRVYLTEEGRKVATELRHVLADYVSEIFGSMPEADRRELARLLGCLRENITRAAGTWKGARGE